MSDISAQPIPDFGQLLSSFGQHQADIAQAQANTAFINGPQTQGTLARAGLENAQTNLVGQQARRQALEIQMIKDAMANAKPPDNSQDDQSAIDPTDVGISSALNKKLFVDPAGDPNLMYRATQMGMAGMNSGATALEKWNALQVASRKARAQNEAVDIWQTASKLNDANVDHPLQTLLTGVRPGSFLNSIGRAIDSNPNMSPEEKDAAARTAINSAAQNAYQYTGRKPTKAGDKWVDEISGKEVGAPSIGLSPGEKLEKNKFESTPQTVTQGNAAATVYPNLKNPTSPKAAPSGGPGAPGQDIQGQIPGLTPEQSQFVHDQKAGFTPPPGNQQLNEVKKQEFDTYNKQRADLAKATSTETARAQDTLTHINQINNLLNTKGLTLGPGSHEYSQLQTVFNQWLGTSAGQAGAYQVLSKVLNASEMNDLLNQFHSEGAQVRLGAYESRLIMEKLAANPNLTKEAIQQMLKWQASDAKYIMDKANTAKEVMKAGKSVENFSTEYASRFPKQDIVDSTVTALNGGKELKFENAKGKSYSLAEVKSSAAQLRIPLPMFEEQLKQAGATIK